MLFTEEQLQELETIFNLKRNTEVMGVRDGFVTKNRMLWWRYVSGPQYVNSTEHWDNIKEYPKLYSIGEPKTTITYVD